MLRLKQVEIQQNVDEEQARLARVERRLRQIEQEEAMPAQEVVLKTIPAQQVAAVRDVVALQGLGQLFGEVFGYLGQHRISPVGPPVGVYYDEEFREEMDVEVAVPVAGPVPEAGRVKMGQLPAVETMACVVHEGGYDTFGATYGQLMTWIEANGYRIAGPIREVYLRGPESGNDPSTYVTEVPRPVAAV
jgi:effector-binding domain-containing protein